MVCHLLIVNGHEVLSFRNFFFETLRRWSFWKLACHLDVLQISVSIDAACFFFFFHWTIVPKRIGRGWHILGCHH